MRAVVEFAILGGLLFGIAEPGDVGTVVHAYADGCAFEIEFTTLSGMTVVVATVRASEVRPAGAREITHARELAAN